MKDPEPGALEPGIPALIRSPPLRRRVERTIGLHNQLCRKAHEVRHVGPDRRFTAEFPAVEPLGAQFVP